MKAQADDQEALRQVMAFYHETLKESPEALHYSGWLGRLVSPDDPLEGDYAENPQTWNRYSYALNNSLVLTDPSGHDPGVDGVNPETGNICVVGTSKPGGDETVKTPGDLITGFGIEFANGFIDLGNLFAWLSERTYGTGPLGPIRGEYIQSKNLGQKRGELLSAVATILVPNPLGRRGGLLHQAKIGQVEAQLEAKGLRAVREYRVDTPGSTKAARFVDVAGLDANGNVVELHQIGPVTGGGQPVSRKRLAIDDIQKATGQTPTFHPYNR